MMQNKLDLNDYLEQLRQIRKMGSIKDLIGMLPGVGGKIDESAIDERQFFRMEAILTSMTPKEREKPELLNASRKRRIAAGSGTRVEDVNRLLKQFEQMQAMMKQMTGKKGRKARRAMAMMNGLGQ